MITTLSNRTITDGVVKYTQEGLADYLLKVGHFDPLLFDETEETIKYNELQEQFGTNRFLINKEPERKDEWFVPDKYFKIDLDDYFMDKAKTYAEKDRVQLELKLFRQRKMEKMLYLMMFLVDFMEERDIVWGVGRGSSVASYCLFLIGINDINPIEHNIPIEEFLR